MKPRFCIRNLPALKGTERGSMMIEMLVTITVMAIVTYSSILFFTSMINEQARAAVRDTQRGDANQVYDYLDSNLGSVEVGECGLLTDGGTRINPVSLAGDQLVCHREDDCWRFFYLALTKQLRVAVSTDGCEAIAPTRGPNQTGGDLPFDPVLDTDNSMPLSEKVILSDGGNDTATAPLFRYSNASGHQLTPAVDNQADSVSSNVAYLDPAALSEISTVELDGMLAGQTALNAKPFALHYQLYLNR